MWNLPYIYTVNCRIYCNTSTNANSNPNPILSSPHIIDLVDAVIATSAARPYMLRFSSHLQHSFVTPSVCQVSMKLVHFLRQESWKNVLYNCYIIRMKPIGLSLTIICHAVPIVVAYYLTKADTLQVVVVVCWLMLRIYAVATVWFFYYKLSSLHHTVMCWTVRFSSSCKTRWKRYGSSGRILCRILRSFRFAHLHITLCKAIVYRS